MYINFLHLFSFRATPIFIFFYTLEHYKPDTRRASGSVFKGNVTDKSIESEGHRRCPSGFKCLSVYTIFAL